MQYKTFFHRFYFCPISCMNTKLYLISLLKSFALCNVIFCWLFPKQQIRVNYQYNLELGQFLVSSRAATHR